MLLNNQKTEDINGARIESLLGRIAEGDRHAVELLYRCGQL